MQIFSILAVYFVIWWITLFAVLPIGLRTQADDNEIVPGSVESAPSRFRPARVLLLNSAVAGVIYAAWYISSTYLGFGFDALPVLMPDFK